MFALLKIAFLSLLVGTAASPDDAGSCGTKGTLTYCTDSGGMKCTADWQCSAYTSGEERRKSYGNGGKCENGVCKCTDEGYMGMDCSVKYDNVGSTNQCTACPDGGKTPCAETKGKWPANPPGNDCGVNQNDFVADLSARKCKVGKCEKGICEGDEICSPMTFPSLAGRSGCVGETDDSQYGVCRCGAQYYGATCQLSTDLVVYGAQPNDFVIGGATCKTDMDCSYKGDIKPDSTPVNNAPSSPLNWNDQQMVGWGDNWRKKLDGTAGDNGAPSHGYVGGKCVNNKCTCIRHNNPMYRTVCGDCSFALLDVLSPDKAGMDKHLNTSYGGHACPAVSQPVAVPSEGSFCVDTKFYFNLSSPLNYQKYYILWTYEANGVGVSTALTSCNTSLPQIHQYDGGDVGPYVREDAIASSKALDKLQFGAVICPRPETKVTGDGHSAPIPFYWTLELASSATAAYLADKTGIVFSDGVVLDSEFKSGTFKYKATAPWDAKQIFVYASAAAGCSGEKIYINGYNNSLVSAQGKTQKIPLTLNKGGDTAVTIEVVSKDGAQTHKYFVIISQVTQPLPWGWIVLGGCVALIGMGVGSFYGYISYLRSLYQEKSIRERPDLKNPLLEYCRTCKKNVDAKKYVGEDVCPECGGWL